MYTHTFSFCSVAQSCRTLWDPTDCRMPGSPVLHHLPELVPTHVHWVSDVIQPPHPLLPPSPPGLNPSQRQGLLQWVNSLHQVAKGLEIQLQHQSFQWIFRVNFLYDWLVWSPCCLSGFQVFSNTTVQKHQFFSVQTIYNPSFLNSIWTFIVFMLELLL